MRDDGCHILAGESIRDMRRAKRRLNFGLRCFEGRSFINAVATLFMFVIPSEAEGSAFPFPRCAHAGARPAHGTSRHSPVQRCLHIGREDE